MASRSYHIVMTPRETEKGLPTVKDMKVVGSIVTSSLAGARAEFGSRLETLRAEFPEAWTFELVHVKATAIG